MNLKIFILAGVFLFLFVVEKFQPLRWRKLPMGPRTFVNCVMSILTYATAFYLVAPSTQIGTNLAANFKIGVLNWIPVSGGWQVLLALLLLDLLIYYWHRLNHKIPWLWRFHNVHHYDPDLDVTTSFRFHFVEVGYSSIFRFLQVLVVGAPIEVFGLYEFLFQAATFFHHSNWKLPYNFEKWLNLVFVTPRMHGIHHSQVQSETDSNYSVLFSFWDRLHRTFVGGVCQKEIIIGVPAYDWPSDQKLISVLTSPFSQQRDYWNKNQTRNTQPDLGVHFIKA